MKRSVLIAMGMASACVCGAQEISNEPGFRAGFVRIRPEVEALTGYDNRVLNNESNQSAEGDIFSELTAAAYAANSDARYDVLVRGLYGYRSYSEYNVLSDDFYDVGGAIKSDKTPLKLGVSAFFKKTLDYDTSINPGLGQEPGSVLTDLTSTRLNTRANISYEKNISERTSVEPGYDLWYYFQNFEDESSDAEWQTHQASLKLGYVSTPKTKVSIAGYYSVQVNDDEDGNIGSLKLGIESILSDKMKWIAQIGISAADYELSGSDQGVISYLKGVWNMSDKVSAYLVGGNDFQPGYSGNTARMVYRVGYGADWRVVERWLLSAQLLHDYQDALGGGSTKDGVGEVRHFATGKVEYTMTRSFSLALLGRYAKDEEPTDKMVVSLLGKYAF